MEATAKQQERENNNTSPTNSPNSNGSSTTSPNNCINIISNTSSNNNNNNNNNNSGVGGGGGGMGGVLQNQTPPQTPKPITRSDQTNPYPTTFVQADTSTFKQVVQMLTGSPSSESSSSKSNKPEKNSIPPIKNSPKKQQSFKLYERRNQLKNNLMINTLVQGGINNICWNNSNNGFSPRHQPEILSPSMLDFPKLVLSPVTPLNEDPFNHNNKMRMSNNHSCSSLSSPLMKTGSSSSEEEDKAIAEKGFFLHPSPRNPSTPRDSEPQLLPLFPLTSPRVSASST